MSLFASPKASKSYKPGETAMKTVCTSLLMAVPLALIMSLLLVSSGFIPAKMFGNESIAQPDTRAFAAYRRSMPGGAAVLADQPPNDSPTKTDIEINRAASHPFTEDQEQQPSEASVDDTVTEEDIVPEITASNDPYAYLEISATSHYAAAQGKSHPTPSKPSQESWKRVAILGERNSGTNLMVELMDNNVVGLDISPGLFAIKHYFQPWPETERQLLERNDGTLVVMITRNPYDWLNSMYITCYCCEHLSRNQNTSFPDFINATFETALVNPYNQEKRPTDACPIDRNIYKDDGSLGVFSDIMAARYEKLDHFLNISTWNGLAGFEMVRWEDMLSVDQQKEWFNAIAEKWNLPRKDEFQPMAKDAREWKEEEFPGVFSHQSRIAKSVYLNSTLLPSDNNLTKQCQVTNMKFNERLESLMGYKKLEC